MNNLAKNDSQELSVFNESVFAQMQRVAAQLAASSLVPESLRTEGNKEHKKELPLEVIEANCFRVVEQAYRWGASPFALIDHASLVRGKLQWEGKVIHALIEVLFGVRLKYSYTGNGMDMEVVVSGKFANEDKERTIKGRVRDWKTETWPTGEFEQRLAYRGARTWGRLHSPSVLLGIITTDEELPASNDNMRNVTQATTETPENPFEQQSIPVSSGVEMKPSEVKEEANTAKDQVSSSPSSRKTPATGRQKKDRHHRPAKFVDITERTGNGKIWWVVVLNIGGESVEMGTFSETLSNSLRELTKGDNIDITFTRSHSGYALEDYVINTDEGIC